MHQIDNAWVTTTKPPAQPVGTPGYFQPGDEATQLLATVVDYDWANSIQSELINVVTNAGLTPDKQNDAQLVNSIITIVNREVGFAEGGPYLPLAGGVMGGTIYSDGAAGNARQLVSRTAGKNRWIAALADNSAENGGNTGSDFTLSRCDDNGNVIDVVMRCHRYTGVVDFPMGMTYGSGVIGGGPGGGANLPTDPSTNVLNQNTEVWVSIHSVSGTQFQTLAAAWATVRLWDLNGFTLTITVSAWDEPNGTEYPTAGVIFDCRMYGQTNASQLIVRGDPTMGQASAIYNAASPPGAQSSIGCCIGATGGAMLTVGDRLRLVSTGQQPTSTSPSVGLWAHGEASQIVLAAATNFFFGNCVYADILADAGTITIGATPGSVVNYGFADWQSIPAQGSLSHWHTRNGGVIDLSAGTLNITTTGAASGVAFSGAFAIAETGGHVAAPATGGSFPWAVKPGITGKRYQVDATSSITNTAANINYLPGNAVGTVAPGGVYS